ncbi:MAG: hypothetical protein WCP14_03445 [bacterium]
MKALIFINDDGPECRSFLEIGKQLEAESKQVEYLEWEDADTNSVAQLYDIYNPPALVIVREDGSYIEGWQDSTPSYSEVSSRV